MRQSVCQSMERPKMNRKSQRSVPVQRSGSQLKIPQNPSKKVSCTDVQEAPILSRTYEQHHYPSPALVPCKCLMCTDQESDVVHRFCSNWRPLVGTDTRMAYVTGLKDY